MHVFGIVEEAKKKCSIYMFGEDERLDGTGAIGSNSVISMLHHWLLKNQDRWPMKLHIHTDNCSGQNKNNVMMFYLVWAMEMHDGMRMLQSVMISFMLPGHTKFAPDAYFGMFKSKYFASDRCDDMQDLMSVAETCTLGRNVTPVHFSTNSGDHDCVWRDWKVLDEVYYTIKNIKSHHHIMFIKPHVLQVKALIDSEWSAPVDMLRPNAVMPSISDVPVIQCQGIPTWRQLQLHKDIRMHIQDPVKRDTMWPAPVDVTA